MTCKGLPSVTAKLSPSGVAAGALLVFTACFFWRGLLRGEVLFWGDSVLQAHPWQSLLRQAAARGELALWNPFVFCGLPFVTNPQPAAFYPVNLLFLPFSVPRALVVSGAFHLFAASVGAFLLLRGWRLSTAGALLGAVVYGFGGYFTAKLQFQPVINVVAWLPWVLWALDRLAGRPVARRAVSLAVMFAFLILGGHVQFSLLAAVLAFFYALALSRRLGGRQRAHFLLHGFAAGTLAVLLCTAQWLPVLQIKPHSTRASLTYEQAAMFSYPWWQSPTVALPDLFGNPASQNYWGSGNFFEVCTYPGVLTVVLALMGVVALSRRRRRCETTEAEGVEAGEAASRWRFALLSWFALLGATLALGRFGPVYGFFYDHLTPFRIFRAPARFLFWAHLAVACWAGLGLDALLAPGGTEAARLRRHTSRLSGALSVTALLFATVLVFTLDSAEVLWAPIARWCFAQTGNAVEVESMSMFAKSAQGATALSLLKAGALLGLAALLFSAYHRGFLTLRRLGASLSALVALDLWLFGSALFPMTSADFYQHEPRGEEKLGADLSRYRVFTPHQQITALWHAYYNYGSFGSAARERIVVPLDWFIPNANAPREVPNAEGYDVLRVRWFESVLRSAEEALDGGRVEGHTNVMAARFVLQPKSEELGVTTGPRIVQNPDALPRAFVTDVAALRQPVMTVATKSVPQYGTVEISGHGYNSVKVRTDSEREGQLVLLDTLFPGWRVAVDGHPSELHCAWEAFRTVALSAGAHEVRFDYVPVAFKLGLFVSLMSVAALVAVYTGTRRRSG